MLSVRTENVFKLIQSGLWEEMNEAQNFFAKLTLCVISFVSHMKMSIHSAS